MEPQRLATGAAAVVQLVALLNHAACAAEAVRRGDPQRDCTRRIYDAGGGIPGIRAQLKRQQGVLQVIRKARLAVVQAAHALAALRPDALAHLRLRAECILTARDGLECVIRRGLSSCATPPGRTRRDVGEPAASWCRRGRRYRRRA
jgi:hypothetical protein